MMIDKFDRPIGYIKLEQNILYMQVCELKLGKLKLIWKLQSNKVAVGYICSYLPSKLSVIHNTYRYVQYECVYVSTNVYCK